jgi:hypothetical protein
MPGFELVNEDSRQPAGATKPDSAALPARVWTKSASYGSAPAGASKAPPAASDSDAAIDDLRTKFIRPDRERPRARPQADSASEPGTRTDPPEPTRRGKTILRHVRPKGTTDSDRQSPNTKAVLIKDGKIYSSQG